MYVCICHGVTDHQIREVVQAGCSSVAELTMRTGAGANCGSCLAIAAELIEQAHERQAAPLPLPVLSDAA